MSYSMQCGLGFLFAAVIVILWFAAKFRDAGNDAQTNSVALQAYGESHMFSLVAIILVVVAVLIAVLKM